MKQKLGWIPVRASGIENSLIIEIDKDAYCAFLFYTFYFSCTINGYVLTNLIIDKSFEDTGSIDNEYLQIIIKKWM